MEEFLNWMTILALMGFIGLAGIASCQRVVANRNCLKAGYPEAKIDFTLNKYCIKRVNQTDIVVPFSELK